MDALKDEILQPRGPRAMAERIAAEIAALEGELASAGSPSAAKRLRKNLKLRRDMLRWCKTRAGY